MLEILWATRAPLALLDGPTILQYQANPVIINKPFSMVNSIQTRNKSASRLLPASCCVDLPHRALVGIPMVRIPIQRFKARHSVQQRCQQLEWHSHNGQHTLTPRLTPRGSRCSQSQSLLLGALVIRRRYGKSHMSFLLPKRWPHLRQAVQGLLREGSLELNCNLGLPMSVTMRCYYNSLKLGSWLCWALRSARPSWPFTDLC